MSLVGDVYCILLLSDVVSCVRCGMIVSFPDLCLFSDFKQSNYLINYYSLQPGCPYRILKLFEQNYGFLRHYVRYID